MKETIISLLLCFLAHKFTLRTQMKKDNFNALKSKVKVKLYKQLPIAIHQK